MEDNPKLSARHILNNFGYNNIKILQPDQRHIITLKSANGLAVGMGMRLLKFNKKLITPVHMHKDKEKIYLAISGCGWIFTFINGYWKFVQCTNANSICSVPKSTPHAVLAYPDTILLVITSNQDSDTEWEKDYRD